MKRCLSWLFILFYCLASASPLSHRTGGPALPADPEGSEPHPGFLYLELILDRCLPADDADGASAPLVVLKKKRAVLRQNEASLATGDDSAALPTSSDAGPAPGLVFPRNSGPAALLSHVLLSHLASGLSPPVLTS